MAQLPEGHRWRNSIDMWIADGAQYLLMLDLPAEDENESETIVCCASSFDGVRDALVRMREADRKSAIRMQSFCTLETYKLLQTLPDFDLVTPEQMTMN